MVRHWKLRSDKLCKRYFVLIKSFIWSLSLGTAEVLVLINACSIPENLFSEVLDKGGLRGLTADCLSAQPASGPKGNKERQLFIPGPLQLHAILSTSHTYSLKMRSTVSFVFMCPLQRHCEKVFDSTPLSQAYISPCINRFSKVKQGLKIPCHLETNSQGTNSHIAVWFTLAPHFS